MGKATDEAQIMAAILAEGPVYVGFTVYQDIWTMDPKKVYSPDTSTAVQGGHAVAAYGWGVDNGVAYWHLQNSWGQLWGEGGSFRMARGKGLIDAAYFGSVNPFSVNPIDTMLAMDSSHSALHL